jgi:hypothetical protein
LSFAALKKFPRGRKAIRGVEAIQSPAQCRYGIDVGGGLCSPAAPALIAGF